MELSFKEGLSASRPRNTEAMVFRMTKEMKEKINSMALHYDRTVSDVLRTVVQCAVTEFDKGEK